jgi:hypothetical protein
MKNIAICSVNFSISFFSPVKPQPKKIIVEDYAIEKKKKKRKRKNSPLFILLSRVLFIINEEDTRRLKIAMMFSSSDRASFFPCSLIVLNFFLFTQDEAALN